MSLSRGTTTTAAAAAFVVVFVPGSPRRTHGVSPTIDVPDPLRFGNRCLCHQGVPTCESDREIKLHVSNRQSLVCWCASRQYFQQFLDLVSHLAMCLEHKRLEQLTLPLGVGEVSSVFPRLLLL